MNTATIRTFVIVAVLGCAACKNEGATTAPPTTATSATNTPVASAVTAPPATSASATPAASASAASATVSSFDTDTVNAPPAGFSFGKTGQGKPGKWIVRAETDAPSKGNVLAQTDTDDTDYRFPVAVREQPVLADVSVHVRCKPVGGKVDRACGLVFRYKDENNYFLTRANALENNVRLYVVKDGKRSQIAGWNGPVKSDVWHELRADAVGDRIEVTWNGTKIITHRDSTFKDAGRAGLWTKADSVTYFDDLSIEAAH